MVDFRSLKIILLDKAIFIFFVFIFLFIIFFAGNCLSAISSRRTLADAKITLNFDHDRKENINVFAKLARAHNNTGLLKTNTSTWQASGIFIERLVIAIDKKIVSDLKSVVITLDKKSFYYDQNSLFSQWKQSSPREYGYKVSDNNMLVLESPDSLYLERSRIPIKNHFFSSLINWRGDQLIYRFTWLALFSSLIVWVWLLLAYLIYHLYFRRKLDSSNIIKDDAIGVKLSAIVFLTIFVEIIIITVIKKFYNPDVSLILNNAAQIYLDNVMISFIPKPVEQMQYTLGVLFAPFLIIFNYFFYEWLIKQSMVIKYKNFFVKFILLGLLLVPIFIYFGLIMSDFFYIKSSISSNVLGFVVYAFIFFPVLLYLFAKKKFENLLKILLTTEFIAVLFSIFAFTAASFIQIIDVYHFNPVYFPQTQLFFNKVILQQVVSLYGLFPLLLKPIFNLLGVSVINFTVIMGLLIICCFLSLFKFLKIVVSNKILALLGILGILSYTFFGVAFGTGLYAPYLQYWPIRTLGVSIILLLSALYWKKPSRLLYNLGFFCATLFIFFNFDSGIVVFLSWVLFLLYLEFWQRGNKSILDVVKLIFRHCLYAFFYCLAVFAFFIFY